MNHLAAFVSLARQGNFTRASAALAISQPTLTAVIKQLEAAAGLQLLDRTTRRLHLTQAGERFLSTAETLVTDFDRALTALREIAGRKRGCVRVASVPAFVVRVLPKVLQEFSREYPGIAVQIREENVDSVLAMLESGKADIGFASEFASRPDLKYDPT